MEAETAKLVEHLKRAEQANEHDRLFAEVLRRAADTIERLTIDRDEARDWINNAVVACNKRGCSSLERRLREADELCDEFREERDMAMSELEPLVEQAERLQQERDAALAEVERLNEENQLLEKAQLDWGVR